MKCETCNEKAIIKVNYEGVRHNFCLSCYNTYYNSVMTTGTADWDLIEKRALPRRYAK